MKKITILTLFPQMIQEALNHSIIKRAQTKNLISFQVIDFRDFSTNKHHNVDDVAYGGGPGMVLSCQPIVDAIKYYRNDNTKVIALTPGGTTYVQKIAYQLANDDKDLIIVCGHYEGFDERIFQYVDQQISIGDFILTGGELAALVVIDSITRLTPNVIKAASHLGDSFANGLLDYPHYTKPREFDGHVVPEVLFNGNHKLINAWRKQAAYDKTLKNRPDLIKKIQGGN